MADRGNSSHLPMYVSQGQWHSSPQLNAAKPNGRQTDDHTFLLTEHISACQTRLRGLREVRVAEQEQAGSLSMLLTTKWMSQYLREPHLFLFMNTSGCTTALGNAPKC